MLGVDPHDGWQDILTWDVTSDLDLEEARKDRFHLWTAIFHMHKDAATGDKDDAWKKAIKTQAILNSLEIRSLDADLSLKNAAPVTIRITSQTVNGSLTLSENALMNLTIKGGIPPVVTPAGRPGTNPGALDVGLDALKLDNIDLLMLDSAPSTGAHQLKQVRSRSGRFTMCTSSSTASSVARSASAARSMRTPRTCTGPRLRRSRRWPMTLFVRPRSTARRQAASRSGASP